MPIQPVSGDIKAQPLNNNFSYLDSKVDQVSGGPKETFTSVTALQAKYPNGNNSAMLVTDSNGANGYLYTWNSSSWVKGTLYQAQGIPEGSVTASKITDESINEEKTTFYDYSRNLFNVNSDNILKNKGYSALTSNIVDSPVHNISDAMFAVNEKILISSNGTEVSGTESYKVISYKDEAWIETILYVQGGVYLHQDANLFKVQYVNTAKNIQVQRDKVTPYEEYKPLTLKEKYTNGIRINEDMLVNNSVSPSKTNFFDVGKNLFDPDSPYIQKNKAFTEETNNLITTDEYNLSAKMYAQPSSILYITVNNGIPTDGQGFKIIEYDSNGNWLRTKRVSVSNGGIIQLTEEVNYFLLQYRPNLSKIMVSTESKEYEPFKKTRVKNQFVTIDDEEQIADGIITQDKLAFDINGEISKKVDLILFAGQSNMAGRGTANEAPAVKENIAFEFRAISDPSRLYPIIEPFGVNENLSSGISESTKTGSLVSSFVNKYYTLTNRKIVGVSASKGGTKIGDWQSTGVLLTDALNRFQKAVDWLEGNGYKISGKWLVWCQGESDGDASTSAEDYTNMLKATISEFESSGIEHTFLIRIGNHRDYSQKYDTIIQAQTDFCRKNQNVTLIATTFDRFSEDGLMKDEFHYSQEGYNICGTHAGANLAYFVINGKEPTMFDWENQNLYFSEKL